LNHATDANWAISEHPMPQNTVQCHNTKINIMSYATELFSLFSQFTNISYDT